MNAIRQPPLVYHGIKATIYLGQKGTSIMQSYAADRNNTLTPKEAIIVLY